MIHLEQLLTILFCVIVTLCVTLLALKLGFFDKLIKHRLQPLSEAVSQTPCERLTTHYLNTYGKFPRNRMWQLDSKIRNNKPLTKQETQFIRVCLMREHLIACDPDKAILHTSIFKDDDKMYDCINKWSIELNENDEWLTV